MSKRGKPTPFTRKVAQAMNDNPEVTQEILGDLIGASQGTMSNYLNGVTLPSKSDAQKMGERLNTDLMPEWGEVRRQRKEDQAKRRLAGRIRRKKETHTALPQIVVKDSNEIELVTLYRSLKPKQRAQFRQFIVIAKDKTDHFLSWLEKAS